MARQLVSLSNHCDFLAGYSFKSSRFSHSPEDVPLVKGENLGHREIDWIKAVRWPASEAKDFEKFELNPGDVVLAMDRPIVQGRLKFSWIRNHEPRALLVQRVARLRGYNGLETDFLRYLVASPAFQAHIETITTGVNVPHISGKDILSYSFALPTLSTQQRIAEILSNYDRLIDNNNRRITLLEESIHLLYKEWFVRSRFPGYKSVKVVDGIPEGWRVLTLDDIVLEIIDYRGKTPKKLGSDWSNSGIIALSALNVKKGKLVNLEKSKLVNEDLYQKWMKSELKQGDILMTSEAPLGELYYLAEDNKFCLSQRLYSIRANPEVIKPVILFCALNSSQIQGEIHARKSGTTVFGIRQSELRKVPIIVPSIEIQNQASEILNNLFIQKEKLQKTIYKLQQARDLLLPRLMNGSIAV